MTRTDGEAWSQGSDFNNVENIGEAWLLIKKVCSETNQTVTETQLSHMALE